MIILINDRLLISLAINWKIPKKNTIGRIEIAISFIYKGNSSANSFHKSTVLSMIGIASDGSDTNTK